jgi:Putative MetA-pathway of phenol degradation
MHERCIGARDPAARANRVEAARGAAPRRLDYGVVRAPVLLRGLLPLFWIGLSAVPARAFNHGPGTSGGGSRTESGETLKQGRWSMSLWTEATTFKHVSDAEAEARAIAGGEFDSIDSALLESVSLDYGVTDDLQLGLTTGYYVGTSFVQAEADGMGGAELSTADPRGLTDLWIRAKLRLMHGPAGHLALLGGFKLPTGKDDETLSNGEPLEPSSQPGTGAVDYLAGLAYSRYLTPRLTLDASAAYTLRTEHDGFRVGDRADAGVALAWRLTEDVRAPNNWSVFGELTGVWIGKDEEDGVKNENSGGTTLYLTGGVRDRVNEHVALSLAPALPVAQDVNGDQVETQFKLALALSFTW